MKDITAFGSTKKNFDSSSKETNLVNTDPEIERQLERITLMSDIFMTKVFDNNLEATGLVLSIILGENVKVISAKAQYDIKSYRIDGRGIRLDVLAQRDNGEMLDLEVQCDIKKAPPQRIRYYSCMLDSGMLKKGQDFNELKESYVIFIMSEDYYRRGLPLYKIDRMISFSEWDLEPFNDGSHIIIVNGAYEGNDPVGQLIHDFNCSDPSRFNFRALGKDVDYFKRRGGKKVMYNSLEEYGNKIREESMKEGKEEGREEGKEEVARNLISDGGMDLYKIATLTGVPLDRVKEISKSI